MAAWPIAGPLLVPARLSSATIAAAMATAAGRAWPGIAAPTSAALIEGVLGAMSSARLKVGIGLASAILALERLTVA
jgi:hypothetical protein